MTEWEQQIKSQCKAERRFQDTKEKQLRLVHDVLHNTDYTEDEKYIILITEGGFGRERAQMLVYGKVKFMQTHEFKPYTPIKDGRIR